MSEDLISRQAAINAIIAKLDAIDHVPQWVFDELTGAIGDLPSAQQERKKGKWNCGDDMFEYAICSACKWDSGEAWEYAKKYFRYCPHCGADMRGEADE